MWYRSDNWLLFMAMHSEDTRTELRVRPKIAEHVNGVGPSEALHLGGTIALAFAARGDAA